MKALSIRQPWAWAIVNGYKPVENRTTNFVGDYTGEVLIHSGRLGDEAHINALKGMMRAEGHDPDDVPDFDDLPRGGVVGRAVITGIVRHYNSEFFCGPFGIVLRGAKPMKLAPCLGRLGLFEIDAVALGIAEPAASQQGNLM